MMSEYKDPEKKQACKDYYEKVIPKDHPLEEKLHM
jgi:hypothetical protein